MPSNEESKKNSELADISKQPWLDAAYKSALAFYEKDSQLDSKDRLELSKSYRNIASAEQYGGWLGFTAVFLPPFFWKFHKTKTFKGVNVPRNFALGLLVLFGTTQLSGNYMFNKKLDELNPNGTFGIANSYDDDIGEKQAKTNAQRQWEMMKLLNNGGATKWAAYFSLTFSNPERRFPDPRVKLAEMNGSTKPGGLLQHRDIMGLYSGPDAERRRREGIPDADAKPKEVGRSKPFQSSWDVIRAENNVPSESNGASPIGSGSSWDKIRQQGLQQEDKRTENSRVRQPDSDNEDPFETLDHPSQSEFDALLDREREGGKEE